MRSSFYRRFRQACALLTSVFGAMTLVGWVSGHEALASLRREYIPMAPSTAFAFALLGLVMLIRSSSVAWRRISDVLIGCVAVVAVAKLFEFLSGVSMGMDEMLVADPAMFGSVKKGRMSPITASNFILMCVAIFAVGRATWRKWSGLAAMAALGISFIVMMGYMHGTPLLYAGHIIPVALPTATAFLLLALSVILEAGPEQWPLKPFHGDSTRAVLLRWFLPVVIATALADGCIRTQFLTGTTLNPALSSALSTLTFTGIVGAVIFKVASMVGGRIDRAEGERNVARQELEELNQDLERRIEERTRELREKNGQMQEELTMARELQLALLPQHFPTVPKSVPPPDSALKFFSFYYPTGSVSGDFYNVFPISDSSVGIFICDVMGHGVRAALVTSMMRALLEEHSGADPGRLLTDMNRDMHSILKNAGTTMYATAVMLIADVGKSELRFSNAGHPKPLHVRRCEGDTAPLANRAAQGPALGLFAESTYGTATLSMAPGDLIMLFTDGLFEVEGPDEQLYSQEDLLGAVRKRQDKPPRQLLEEVLSEVKRFSQRPDFEDDVCLIGVEVTKALQN